MIETLRLFEERKIETEFYYSVLCEIGSDSPSIRTTDNHRLLKIMKSNFLLMLYNLVESCVRRGFEEIYDTVVDDGAVYTNIIDELQIVWENYEISRAYQITATKDTYACKVREMIQSVISKRPIVFDRNALDISGNLDARQMKVLMAKHRIHFSETDPGDKFRILSVKNKRNSLAHGDESFSEAARDLSVADLDEVKNEVLTFIGDIMCGMKQFCDNRNFSVAIDKAPKKQRSHRPARAM